LPPRRGKGSSMERKKEKGGGGVRRRKRKRGSTALVKEKKGKETLSISGGGEEKGTESSLRSFYGKRTGFVESGGGGGRGNSRERGSERSGPSRERGGKGKGIHHLCKGKRGEGRKIGGITPFPFPWKEGGRGQPFHPREGGEKSTEKKKGATYLVLYRKKGPSSVPVGKGGGDAPEKRKGGFYQGNGFIEREGNREKGRKAKEGRTLQPREIGKKKRRKFHRIRRWGGKKEGRTILKTRKRKKRGKRRRGERASPSGRGKEEGDFSGEKKRKGKEGKRTDFPVLRSKGEND